MALNLLPVLEHKTAFLATFTLVDASADHAAVDMELLL